MDEHTTITFEPDDGAMREATLWAGAFLAGFKSVQTRRAYRRDIDCWLSFCLGHQLHPFRDLRRTHLELYLRELEALDIPPAPGTLYRRVSTLSSWFRWLEDEDVAIGSPAARIRRPQRHNRPQPWLYRNELTDLLTAAEQDGADPTPWSACSVSTVSACPKHVEPTSLTSPAPAINPRHAKADTTVAYDQSERSFHKDPTFVLMAATAR